eukprot:TRINITY_DN15877_c0_g1_i1.p1 TRINITY_DN15877_c0_g1~~TRINITY_DN15877_c0_g1_i1.p1  ORF type:complete len:326 (+),score=105.27 TRINITY_DN15877_c0_g1_i1:94-1071(+)
MAYNPYPPSIKSSSSSSSGSPNSSNSCNKRRRVGVVGFGSLGQYLTKEILENHNEKYEIVFVWNRTKEKIYEQDKVDINDIEDKIIEDLSTFKKYKPDIIIEVAHPIITEEYGESFLNYCDYLVGSPTVFHKEEIKNRLVEIAKENNNENGLYIPVGALWGGQDIQKMADRELLTGLEVTMKKHPKSLKLCGELKVKLDDFIENNPDYEGDYVLYEGSVTELCPQAPNNVNTIAVAALAASNVLTFDQVVGRLICDWKLKAHHIEINVFGKEVVVNEDGDKEKFNVHTIRYNPASFGAVTGSATYASFLSSLLKAKNQGNGLHLC